MKRLLLFFLLFSQLSPIYAQNISPSFSSVGKNKSTIQVYYRIDLEKKIHRHFTPVGRELNHWIIEAVLQKKLQPFVYQLPDKPFASRTMPLADFKNKLKYYDEAVGDTVAVRNHEFSTLELCIQLTAHSSNKTYQEKIKRISLLYPNSATQRLTPLATFKYKAVRKYLKRQFRKSRRKRYYEALKAFWYQKTPHKIHITSIYKALEQHQYQADVIYFDGASEVKTYGKSVVPLLYGQRPPMFQPDTVLRLQPYFMPTKRQTIRTTLWHRIDLRQGKNKAYNQGRYSLPQAIIEGIRSKKITPYYYSASPFNKRNATPITLKDFFKHLTYKTSIETTVIPPEKMYLIDFQEFYTKNIKRNKTQRKVLAFTLIIPNGTNSESYFGDFRVANVPYRQTIQYLKKLQRAQPKKYAWVTNLLNKDFSAQIIRFSHPEDDYLKNIIQLYSPSLSLDKIEQKAYELSLKIGKTLTIK